VKPQTAAVLALLRARPAGVTHLDALYAGCGSRLAARVAELRAEGYIVRADLERTPNGARIAVYRLTEPRFVPDRGVQESLEGWAPGEIQEAFGR
jgi:hypothetical protein